MECVMCGKELRGGLDTYGDTGYEMCEACWVAWENNSFDSWYGTAPHHHDFEQSGGGWRGSTVFDPLPAPDEDGDIVLRDGLIFRPDPETDGACGMYFESKTARAKWDEPSE